MGITDFSIRGRTTKKRQSLSNFRRKRSSAACAANCLNVSRSVGKKNFPTAVSESPAASATWTVPIGSGPHSRPRVLNAAPMNVVVVGAHQERVRPELAALPVRVVENRLWREGMGSSIRAGIASLDEGESVRAALLMLCDQPFATAHVLGQIVRSYLDTRARVVAFGGARLPRDGLRLRDPRR